MSPSVVASIGVAGYMGAGKSTAVALLCRLCGGFVLDADAIAKEILQSDSSIRGEIVRAFGNDVADGSTLRFGRLGERVFASLDELQRYNRIVHPVVVAQLEKRMAAALPRLCILDAALIPYWGIEKRFDMLFWVDAPAEVRMSRLAAKGVLAPEMIANWMTLQQALFKAPSAKAWIFIRNSGSLAQLEEAVAAAAPS
jgi:dephospho-CoA kinase